MRSCRVNPSKQARAIPISRLIDWIVGEAPAPFLAALKSLQNRDQWQQTRDALFSMWLQGVSNAELAAFIHKDMGAFPFAMWARAAREIHADYAKAKSPLQALSNLAPAVPVLHLYAQPDDPAYLAYQQSFAVGHTWFSVQKLLAQSHFPMFEVPAQMGTAIRRFVA